MLQLDFHCYQTGLADVHVEISFSNQYYPTDFAFTYECGIGVSGLQGGGGVGMGSMLLLLLVGFLGGGCAYNYQVLQKRGEDIIPGLREKPLPPRMHQAAAWFRPSRLSLLMY